jgi:VWFA-related protein
MLRMKTGTRLVSLASCLLALSITGPGNAQESPGQYREQIVVRIIDVDVVVTDRRGNPLLDLRREDFELLEDGKPVEIRYFSRIVDGQLSDAPPLPQETDVQERTATGQTATGRTPLTWVVFLDQTNIPIRHRNHSMQQVRKFLETAMSEGDRAVVASNNGMAFRIQERLTDVRQRVLDTVDRLQKQPVHQGSAALSATRIRNELGHADPSDVHFQYIGQSIAEEISIVIEEEIRRTRSAVQAMSALVDVLAPVEGRLAVIYVGAGFNTLPALSLTEAWRARFPMLVNWAGAPKPEDHQARLEQEIGRLYSNLSAARVTVYTVYAGSSWMPSSDDIGMFMDGGRSGERAELTEAALAKEMSDRTGGLSFKAGPGLAERLGAVRRDLNNYYSLGYVPQGPPGDPRRIRVRVRAEGARVRHREAVRERTESEDAVRATIASLVSPPSRVESRVSRAPAGPVTPASEANPLGVAVQADPPRRAATGRDRLLPFRLAVQMELLTFQRREAVLRAEFIVHFAVSAPDGTVWSVDSREHALEIPAAESPDALGENVTYTWNVDLSPLRLPPQIPVNRDGMQLVVTVEDRVSRAQSVVKIPIPRS